jgi:hypothetical protein
MQRIDRQLFETARETLQECFDELEAAGGIEEYIQHCTPYEKSLVKQVIGLCGSICGDFDSLSD